MTYLPRPTEGGGDFTPPPEGTFPAICYRIVDLGTQESSYLGDTKHQHKVLISWELKDDEIVMDDGRPMTAHQRYTWSMHEKANLRKQLEMWRGRKFADSDFGPGGFDVRNLLGVPGLITIVHADGKEGKVFANVASIVKLPKGMSAGELINPKVLVWLDKTEFDQQAFDDLSDNLKNTIKKSPEYLQMVSGTIRGTIGGPVRSGQQRAGLRPAMPADDDEGRWGPKAEPPF